MNAQLASLCFWSTLDKTNQSEITVEKKLIKKKKSLQRFQSHCLKKGNRSTQNYENCDFLHEETETAFLHTQGPTSIS